MKENSKSAVVLSALVEKSAPLFKKLPSKIGSKKDYEDAAHNMKLIKQLGKEAQEEKDKFIMPLNKLISDVRELFKPFENQIYQSELKLKSQMFTFLEESKQKVESIAAKLDRGEIKKVSTAVKKQNELAVTSNVRKVWTAVATDISKTPIEYLIPDEQRIKTDLKEGKKIKGWEWKQIETITI